MRVAFLNRGREAHPGGDLVALDATMDALRRKGVEVEETGWDVAALDGNFDLAHVFHCNFDWSKGNCDAVYKSSQKWGGQLPYVLTPIFYPGLRSGITDVDLRCIVFDAALVLPFSHREAREMRDELGFFPYEAIPNGTDPKFHCTTPASEREGVLCVSARGESDKNVPLVRAACEKLGLPFTCAAGIPHDQMPAVYARHRVFVNASDSERMSLTVGEALCAGCMVIDSPGNRGAEHYGRYHCVASRFEEWLLFLYNGGYTLEPHMLARKLTWDYVADRLIEVYKWACR